MDSSGVPRRRATAVGLLAIVLFSAIVSLVRVTSQNFGATLGAALIYTLVSVILWTIRRPKNLRAFPRKYMLLCGVLFIVYEVSVGLAVGLAGDSEQAIEVSIVNYLWPTLMVVLMLFVPGAGRASWLIIPGVLLAMFGIGMVVGGEAGLDPGSIASHISSNPVPYALAFAGAMAWAAYSVITPRISRGHDGLTLFITGTAIALWAVHAMAGSVPDRLPGVTAYVVLVAASVAIGAGYGGWNIGILRGNLIVLASASYVTPVFSSIIAALTLGAALTGTFWRGVLMVTTGSLLSWWAIRSV